MRRFSPLLVALLAACGGGGGGGPSDAPPNVAGTYSGTVLFTSATPGTHCFAAGLARLGGHGFQYTITVQQNGSALSGTLDNTDMRITCSFSGSVDGSGAVVFTQTACSDPTTAFPWSFEAQQPCELAATQTGHRFEGQRGMNGTMTLDWTTTDDDTGAELGTLQINARMDLPKSR